eukprot:6210974-Pleurochrysis_carterae.AAC.1
MDVVCSRTCRCIPSRLELGARAPRLRGRASRSRWAEPLRSREPRAVSFAAAAARALAPSRSSAATKQGKGRLQVAD